MARELGLICCAEMVKAFLKDRKTNTRRIEGLKVLNDEPDRWKLWATHYNPLEYTFEDLHDTLEKRQSEMRGQKIKIIKPRYRVGDEMYIKETWAMRTDTEPDTPKAKHYLRYKAGGTDLEMEWHNYERWRSSRFMPKWAARLWYRVKAVRDPQRIRDISEEDCIAEGVHAPQCPDCGYTQLDCRIQLDHRLCGKPEPQSARVPFGILWNSLHKKPGARWEDNPWVFPYELKRIEGPK
jgi:hypothetical protein